MSHLTRRSALFNLPLLVAAARSIVRAASPEAEARAADWLRAWDGQGDHRTATAGDEAGATWLTREAAAITGRPAGNEMFRLERIDPLAAYVEVGGQRIDGEIFFDGPTTGPAGVRGIAGVGAGQIAVLPRL